jgi:hypothetical protein
MKSRTLWGRLFRSSIVIGTAFAWYVTATLVWRFSPNLRAAQADDCMNERRWGGFGAYVGSGHGNVSDDPYGACASLVHPHWLTMHPAGVGTWLGLILASACLLVAGAFLACLVFKGLILLVEWIMGPGDEDDDEEDFCEVPDCKCACHADEDDDEDDDGASTISGAVVAGVIAGTVASMVSNS